MANLAVGPGLVEVPEVTPPGLLVGTRKSNGLGNGFLQKLGGAHAVAAKPEAHGEDLAVPIPAEDEGSDFLEVVRKEQDPEAGTDVLILAEEDELLFLSRLLALLLSRLLELLSFRVLPLLLFRWGCIKTNIKSPCAHALSCGRGYDRAS